MNLAELYFESLEGVGNPSRFTPMNDDVRADFREHRPASIRLSSLPANAARLASRSFPRFSRRSWRAGCKEEWLGELETVRRNKPELDLVLTHVDDRFDTGMRDAIGADARRVLPLLELAQFHVPDRGSGNRLESGAAAISGDCGTLPAADATSKNWPSI